VESGENSHPPPGQWDFAKIRLLIKISLFPQSPQDLSRIFFYPHYPLFGQFYQLLCEQKITGFSTGNLQLIPREFDPAVEWPAKANFSPQDGRFSRRGAFFVQNMRVFSAVSLYIPSSFAGLFSFFRGAGFGSGEEKIGKPR